MTPLTPDLEKLCERLEAAALAVNDAKEAYHTASTNSVARRHGVYSEACDRFQEAATPTDILALIAYARRGERMREGLEEALAYVERFEDVRDGDYGVPEPNEAMQLASVLRAALDGGEG